MAGRVVGLAVFICALSLPWHPPATANAQEVPPNATRWEGTISTEYSFVWTHLDTRVEETGQWTYSNLRLAYSPGVLNYRTYPESSGYFEAEYGLYEADVSGTGAEIRNYDNELYPCEHNRPAVIIPDDNPTERKLAIGTGTAF